MRFNNRNLGDEGLGVAKIKRLKPTTLENHGCVGTVGEPCLPLSNEDFKVHSPENLKTLGQSIFASSYDTLVCLSNENNRFLRFIFGIVVYTLSSLNDIRAPLPKKQKSAYLPAFDILHYLSFPRDSSLLSTIRISV